MSRLQEAPTPKNIETHNLLEDFDLNPKRNSRNRFASGHIPDVNAEVHELQLMDIDEDSWEKVEPKADPSSELPQLIDRKDLLSLAPKEKMPVRGRLKYSPDPYYRLTEPNPKYVDLGKTYPNLDKLDNFWSIIRVEARPIIVPYVHPSEFSPLSIPERLSKDQFTIIVSGFKGNDQVRDSLIQEGYSVFMVPDVSEFPELYVKNIGEKGYKLPLKWIRDAFWDSGQDTYFFPGRRDSLIRYLKESGIPFVPDRAVESLLGEQGRIVADGRVVLVHQSLVEHDHVARLISQGYDVFCTPMPSDQDVYGGYLSRVAEAVALRKKIQKTNDHNDRHVALFTNAKGERMLVVTTEYMAIYGDFVRNLAQDRLQAELVEHTGDDVNFPILPDGRVLVEVGKPDVVAILRKFMGADQVSVIPYLSNDPGGRLRCRINTIRKS